MEYPVAMLGEGRVRFGEHGDGILHRLTCCSAGRAFLCSPGRTVGWARFRGAGVGQGSHCRCCPKRSGCTLSNRVTTDGGGGYAEGIADSDYGSPQAMRSEEHTSELQ